MKKKRGGPVSEEEGMTLTRKQRPLTPGNAIVFLLIDKHRVNDRTKENTSMSVGVMRDEELNLRYPHVSHTLGDSREYNT